jgi:hypothetical protein
MPDPRPPERTQAPSYAPLGALRWALPTAAVVAALAAVGLLGRGWPTALGGALLAFAVAVLLIGGGATLFTHFAARGGAARLLPEMAAMREQEAFAPELSLLAAGKVDQAVERLEARRAEEPENLPLLFLTAETYAREAGHPRRAESLFRAARKLRGISPEQDLYATNRLVDLYRGPLADRAGATRELKRILKRHPKSEAAALVKRRLNSR